MHMNVWWEPLQYSLNQLDLFDMRGCHSVMLPPLRGDNPGWEHQQQWCSCATIIQNKHLIAAHSLPFIVSNKAVDSSWQAKLMLSGVFPKYSHLRNRKEKQSCFTQEKKYIFTNGFGNCSCAGKGSGNPSETRMNPKHITKPGNTIFHSWPETPMFNVHQILGGEETKVLKKLQLPWYTTNCMP